MIPTTLPANVEFELLELEPDSAETLVATRAVVTVAVTAAYPLIELTAVEICVCSAAVLTPVAAAIAVLVPDTEYAMVRAP